MKNAVLLRKNAGPVATLTLNRPHVYNALSVELMHALHDQLKKIGKDPKIKVVVIKGAGPGFCAGHDLKEMKENASKKFSKKMMTVCIETMQKITEIPQPVIAQVHGVATAAGCQLVASCDLAVAADDARFGTPGVLIGLFCSTPMVPFTRNVGRKQAMEMLLTADLIDAPTAQRYGLINRIVPPRKLAAEVESLALKIAEKSSLVVRIGKDAFYKQLEMSVKDAYPYVGNVMVKNMMTHDCTEGISAFLQKRKPVWKNR